HWLRADALTAAILAVLGAGMVGLSRAAGLEFFEFPLWRQMLGASILAVPLVWRRRFPMTAAIVANALYIVLPYTLGMDLYASQVVLFLAFYSVGAWSAQRGWALIVRITISAVMAVWLVSSMFGGFGASPAPASMAADELLAFFMLNSSINIAFFAGAWVFGNRAWQSALERHALEKAHDDIRALQGELVEAAVETERMRIARELHDVVAHHVTAMSVQAAAARRLLGTDPARAEASLKSVEASGRSAVADLRTMVLTLRSDNEETDALPTLADVEALVSTAQEHGQHITYERIGDVPELSPAVELTLYRVAQEGLTNAKKHAGPTANVALRLRSLGDAVELEISDDGRAAPTLLPGTGTGLQGMRERITAVGGQLEAGPKPRGGFMVRASVPTGADV
ncbi:MAG: sensor histidine kinase, partial [Propionibacterium sp.]|nr:sensor histidine kinase [Propionibacterium sp.]